MNEIASAVISLAEKHLGEFRIRNGQVVADRCPFCGGGESGDADTFAIGLHNGAFLCLRGKCGRKGSFRELCEFFGERSTDNISFQTFTKQQNRAYDKPDVELLPLSEEIVTYFARRRISSETLTDWHIAMDGKGNIVFPFYREGELTYVKFRNPNRKKDDKKIPKEWSVENTEPIVFGMDMVSFNKPLVITEGEIDALSVYESGWHNVISVPCGCKNLEWVTLCWDWLEKFNQIILFGDNDDPGIAMVSTLSKRLGEDRCMLPAQYPELKFNGKDYNRLCKDANEILIAYGGEYLYSMIEACEPVPIKGVINLADVQFVDPSTVPRIFTRIPALDNAIGGLGESSVTVMTGKRGEGKSTLNGSLLLNAIQQGYSVCAYSGELSAQKFLEWTLLQATESKYIGVTTDQRTGKLYTTVSKEIQDRIKKWIDGKFFLYDNAYIGEENQQEAILKVFDICARRYGCKLFLVD